MKAQDDTDQSAGVQCLANWYASPEMTQIWSAENGVLERELWIAVLEGQGPGAGSWTAHMMRTGRYA